MGRAPCCDKANVKKGPWSPEEDEKLKAYIDKYGTGGNWIALPQKVGLKRCGKSCRLRWLNYLRPNIKHGDFTEEEDNTILSLYISIGSRWSIIAAQLPGRTDNDIKNYWNTKLKKKLLGRRKQPKLGGGGESSSKEGDEGPSYTPTLSNSALERLQLHMQLQNLQNPLSSNNNNPTLWPKLHPLQEKMIHNLQSSFEKITTNANLIEQFVSLNPSDYNPNSIQGNKPEFYEQAKNDIIRVEEVENSFNESTLSDNSMGFNNGVEIHTSSEINDKVAMNWWSNDQFNLMPWSSFASSLQPSSDVVSHHSDLQDFPLGY